SGERQQNVERRGREREKCFDLLFHTRNPIYRIASMVSSVDCGRKKLVRKSADLKIAPWSKKSVARWLCGGREDAVEAKVHGLRGVVIGPGAGEDEHDAGAGEGTIGEKR